MTKYLPAALLALLIACDEPPGPPPDPPPYPFADRYTCTVAGTTTSTPTAGPAETVAAYDTIAIDTVNGDVLTSQVFVPMVVVNDGRNGGTLLLNYDPAGVPEGGLLTLTFAGAADVAFWSVLPDGTVIETFLSGTCTPSGL